MTPRALLVLALAVPVSLAAQAPRITPAGDPSVRDDSIYALAVRPEDHPNEDYVFLLDDGVVRFEADGRSVTTYRQVIEVFTREAAEQWGEMSFGYEPGRERLTVNWVRVLGTDGHVISTQPAHEQESRASVALSAPVYTSRMIRRLSLGGVAPGTIVDYSYTTETLDPFAPGDYHASWSVTTGRLTRRSRYIVDVPAGVTPAIRERNWHGPRPEAVQGGRHTYLWAAKDVERIESEPFASDSNGVTVSVEVASPRRWEDVGRFYDSLAQGRYTLTPDLAARLDSLVGGARTLDDSLRAVYRWVAQDLRYVSLSLGIGGYQPRAPAQVLETRYGDCKDKATLFIALARRLGVRAWPLLLSSDASADSTMPTIGAFDHVIAAVERPGRPGYLFLDLTADLTPYGELPPGEQGGFALVVKDGGRVEHVVLPRAGAGENRSEVTIVGALDTAGLFTGRFTRIGTGSRQYRLREAFLEPRTDTEQRDFIRSLAGSVFQDASGDSLEAFDGRDLAATPRVSLVVRGGHAVNSSAGLEILTLPIDNLASANLATEVAAHRPRRFPIDVGSVVGPVEVDLEFRVTLPAGWRARLPQNVEAASAFGIYRARYSQEGREVRVSRILTGYSGIQPPERVDDLVAWLRGIARDDVPYLVLEQAGGRPERR